MRPHLVDQSDSLHAGVRAFRRSRADYEELHGRASHEQAEDAYIAVAQATWWACAIDESLWKLDKAAYSQAQGKDEAGRHVRALVWARDRLSHQLPIPVAPENRPFFGGAPENNYVIAISRSFYWIPADDLPPPEAGRERFRQEYEDLLAGKSVRGALYRADQWFAAVHTLGAAFPSLGAVYQNP